MNGFVEKVLGRTLTDRTLTMEQRQYRLVCTLASVIPLFLVFPANLIIHLPMLVNATTLTLAAFSWYCVREAGRGRYHPRAFFLVVVALMDLAWFANAGSHGSIPYYYLAASTLPVILFRGRTRWAMAALLPLNVIALLFLEMAFPWLLTPFESERDRLIDLILNTVFAVLLLSMSVWVAISNHDHERQAAARFSRELAASERNYRELVEHASVIILRVNEPREVTFLNRHAEETFGCRREDVAGRPVDATLFNITPFPGPKGGSPPTTGSWDCEHQRPDGRRLWINWAIQTAASASDGPVELLCVGTDITARRQAEERRQELEAQMQRTQRLESLGILAGGIAHDFNNALMVITGNLSLARDGLRPGSEEAMLTGEAEKAALAARDLTRQLLTFAKGGNPIRTSLSIEKVIRSSADTTLRGSQVHCSISITSDLWPVHGDADQIRQIFNNLLQNSRQAMESGGSVFVESVNRLLEPGNPQGLPPGRYVQVAVRDTGTGIAATHMPRIFDPYFTTRETGSGLGLSVVHSIVKSHRGGITVDSRENVGTTFTILLPATSETDGGDEPSPKARRKAGGRILVMDDEKAVRTTAVRMLQRLGYDAEGAGDGAEAIAMYGSALEAGRRFDVVIMDLTVPGGMGGKDAVVQLKAMDPAARTIVSSGYSNDPVMANHREFGFTAVMTKPYSQKDLQGVVEQVLS